MTIHSLSIDTDVALGSESDKQGHEIDSLPRNGRIMKTFVLIGVVLVVIILYIVSSKTSHLDSHDTIQPTQANPSSGTLVNLTADTFYAFLEEHPVTFVDFDALWCPYSQELAPTWKKLASSIKETAVVALFDCADNSELCEQHEVYGVPTLRLYYDNGKTKECTNTRTVDALAEFVQTTLTGDSGQEKGYYPNPTNDESSEEDGQWCCAGHMGEEIVVFQVGPGFDSENSYDSDEESTEDVGDY